MSEVIDIVDDSSVEQRDDLLCVYPPNDIGGIPIYFEDLDCLRQPEWLTDQIINFQLKVLLNHLPASSRKDVMLFSSHFYSSMVFPRVGSESSQSKKEIQHKRVARWTKAVDIFKKQLIIFPVCTGTHWFLILAVRPGDIMVGVNKL